MPSQPRGEGIGCFPRLPTTTRFPETAGMYISMPQKRSRSKWSLERRNRAPFQLGLLGGINMYIYIFVYIYMSYICFFEGMGGGLQGAAYRGRQ